MDKHLKSSLHDALMLVLIGVILGIVLQLGIEGPIFAPPVGGGG